MSYYDYPSDVEESYRPSKLDIEAEQVALAYEAYVDRLYDEWCAEGERLYEEQLEREHHAWEWRTTYGVPAIIGVIEATDD